MTSSLSGVDRLQGQIENKKGDEKSCESNHIKMTSLIKLEPRSAPSSFVIGTA